VRLLKGRGFWVWAPTEKPRGTVIYLHGYFDTVETAWNKQKLEDQFVRGGRDAAHIVAATPAGAAEKVTWPDLNDLLYHAQTPTAPIVVVAHSGAYRTVLPWVTKHADPAQPEISRLFLLDALYAGTGQMRDWMLRTHPARIESIVATKGPPRQNSEMLHNSLPPDVRLRSTLIVVPYSHMDIVRNGRVIPGCLQRSGLPEVAS